MRDQQTITPDTSAEADMQAALRAQRDSYINEGMVSAATRIDRIDRAIDVLVKHLSLIHI